MVAIEIDLEAVQQSVEVQEASCLDLVMEVCSF